MPRKIGELFFELRTSASALQGDLKEGERQLLKFTDFVKANPLAAVTGLGAAFAGVAFAASQAAAKIDLSFRQVTNTLGASAREAAQLREDLRAVSLASGIAREEVVGMFRAISDNGPNGAANVRAIADAAIALGDVLGGDIAANAGGIDQITDIFQIDPARAREVAAALYAIAAGRVPLGDLYDALSKIGPEAAALGLSFETVASFLTRFLDQGYSVKRVSSLFKELADNGAEGRREIEKLAGSSFDADAAMAQLNVAQEQVNASAEKQYQVLKNRLNDQWIEFGSKALPPVNTALTFLNNLLDGTYAKLIGVGEGSDRAMTGLLKVAEEQRKLDQIKNSPAYSNFVLTQNGVGAPASSGDSLGKRFADIVSATKNLSAMSAKALRENQQQLAAIIAAAGGNDSLRTKAQELQQKVGEAIEAVVKKSQAEAKRSLDKLKEQFDSTRLTILNALDQQQREQEQKASEVTKDISQEAAARERNNKQIAEQITALLKSPAAYEAVRIAQVRANAEEEVRQKLLRAGIPITRELAQQITDAGEAAVEADKLGRLKSGLLGGDPKVTTEIKNTTAAVGDLAEGLSLAAGAAAGIATAFGDAGRNMSALLSGASQLLTALERGQRAGVFDTGKKDAKGNAIIENVGFLGAISGKAGVGAAATATASALSMVAGVAQVANALDLFGNKGREQARILRERAEAFNKALDEFAIASRTDLEDKLRQNLAEANRVSEAAGFTGNFTNIEQIRDQAKSFREIVAAGKIGDANLSKRGAEALRGFAEQLDKLADTAVDNEAKLRVANEASIQRLREDINVRKVALALGNDAADQERTRLELERQEADIRQRYGVQAEDYIADLIAITRAEAALAAETKRRATIMAQLQNDNTFLGGSASEKLQRGLTAFEQAFQQYSGIFDGLDLTTRDGLTKAKSLIRATFESLAADGISEAEQPIVDFLKSLFGDIDSILSSLPDTVDPIASRLEAFNARVQLFGATFDEQLKGLAEIFTGKFGDWFDSVLAGVDLTTDAGRSGLRDAISGQLQAILEDGEIDDGERALYDALTLMFGILNQAIEQAATEAEQAATAAAAKAATARGDRRSTAGNIISIFGLEGVDAFTVKLNGFGAAFASFFSAFDLTSLDGIARANAEVQGIFASLLNMTDAQILEKFGMTREEVVSALLDTSSGLDGLSTSLTSVAEKSAEAAEAAKDFADSVSDDFLRATGNDQGADEAGAKRKRDERLAQLATLGLSEEERKKLAQQIEVIYQDDLDKIAKRYAPKVADAVNATTSGRATITKSGSTTTLVQDFGGLSEVTAQSLAALQREAVAYAAETARATSGMYALFAGGLPAPPSGLLRYAANQTTAATTANGAGVLIGPITINIGALNPMGYSPTEAVTLVAHEASRQLGKLVGQQARFLGSARA